MNKKEGTTPQDLSVRPNAIPACSLPSLAPSLLQPFILKTKQNKRTHTHVHTSENEKQWTQNHVIQLQIDKTILFNSRSGLTNYELQAKSSLPLIFIQPASDGQYYIFKWLFFKTIFFKRRITFTSSVLQYAIHYSKSFHLHAHLIFTMTL